MNNAEYEQREWEMLNKQLDAVRLSPLKDRREARAAVKANMAQDPELVAERISWLINGSYGWGAAAKAKNILNWKGNKPAALMQLVGALEWQCPERFVAEAWNGLTKEQQYRLDAAISEEIKDAHSPIE